MLKVKRSRRARAGVVGAAALAAVVVACRPASAAQKTWAQGSGNWTTDANWEPYGQPVSGDSVRYQDAGNGDETLTYDRTSSLSLVQLDLVATRDTITFLQNGPLFLSNELMVYGGSTVHRVASGAALSVSDFLSLGGASVPGASALVEVANGGTAVARVVLVNQGGSLLVRPNGYFFATSSVSQSGGTATFENDPVAAGAGAWTNKYSLSGGSLLTKSEMIGGPFTHSGGTHTVAGAMKLTSALGSNYVLQGGALNAGVIQVDGGQFSQTGGSMDAAVFIQNGGTVTGVLQNRGKFTYNSGTFTARLMNELGATATATVPSFTFPNGMDNRGTFKSNWGQAVTLQGPASKNSGTLALDNATLNGTLPLENESAGSIVGSGRVLVAVNNSGVITAAGGNLYLSGDLINFGTLANAAGGNLFVQSATFRHVGDVLARSGGSVVFDAPITNDEGRGIALAGGTVSAPSIFNGTGGFISGTGDVAADVLNDGEMTFNGPTRLFGALTNNGKATLTARNSQVLVLGPVVNNGTIRSVSGGSVVFEGGVSEKSAAAAPLPGGAAAGPAVGGGQLVIDPGGAVVSNYVRQSAVAVGGNAGDPASYGRLSIRKRADGGDTSVVSNLSVQADSKGNPLGRIDLADTAMIVDYADGGPSPLPDVRAWITAGYAGGTWAGNGITSSEAAGRANRALGYGEAGDVLGSKGGVFQGQTADGSGVVVRYTVSGDASLDGRVNFDDLLRLAKHYNQSGVGVTWAFGDFNYDATVNFNDLLVLAKNYNGALPGAGAVPGAPAAFAVDLAAAAAASVPEPTAFAMAAGAACVMSLAGSRRRRS